MLVAELVKSAAVILSIEDYDRQKNLLARYERAAGG